MKGKNGCYNIERLEERLPFLVGGFEYVEPFGTSGSSLFLKSNYATFIGDFN
jgi:hypothetical protein